MISRSSGEKVCGFQAKEEEEKSSNRQIPKVAQSSSRRWSLEFRNNPRVVRVSRTFGGKDRHSKVFTVRGLRDRRIRLSVATAVQLYDLQDKLGLGQPSKVIDWLMDVTKHDIDQLPPLQIPHALTRFNQHMLFSPEMFMTSSETCYLSPKLKHQNVTAGLIQKSHELERQCFFAEKGKQIEANGEESNGEKINCTYPGNARPILARNLLPSTCWLNHYSLQNDPPSGHHPQYSQYNLSLSPFGSNGPSMSQRVNTYNTNDDAGFFPSSSISLAPETQFIFCNPSAVNVPPLVPSCSPCWPSSSTTPVVEDETRQMSHFQFFSGSGSQLPFPSFSTPASPKNPIGSLMRPTPTNLALLLSQDQSRAD